MQQKIESEKNQYGYAVDELNTLDKGFIEKVKLIQTILNKGTAADKGACYFLTQLFIDLFYEFNNQSSVNQLDSLKLTQERRENVFKIFEIVVSTICAENAFLSYVKKVLASGETLNFEKLNELILKEDTIKFFHHLFVYVQVYNTILKCQKGHHAENYKTFILKVNNYNSKQNETVLKQQNISKADQKILEKLDALDDVLIVPVQYLMRFLFLFKALDEKYPQSKSEDCLRQRQSLQSLIRKFGRIIDFVNSKQVKDDKLFDQKIQNIVENFNLPTQASESISSVMVNSITSGVDFQYLSIVSAEDKLDNQADTSAREIEHKTQLERLDSLTTSLTESLNSAEITLNQNAEAQKLQQQVAELRQKNQSLSEKVASLETKSDQAKSSLENQLPLLKTEIEKLQQINMKYAETNNKLRQQVTNLDDQVNIKNNESFFQKAELEKRIMQLSSENDTLKKNDTTINIAEYQQKIESLESKIKELQQKNQQSELFEKGENEMIQNRGDEALVQLDLDEDALGQNSLDKIADSLVKVFSNQASSDQTIAAEERKVRNYFNKQSYDDSLKNLHLLIISMIEKSMDYETDNIRKTDKHYFFKNNKFSSLQQFKSQIYGNNYDIFNIFQKSAKLQEKVNSNQYQRICEQSRSIYNALIYFIPVFGQILFVTNLQPITPKSEKHRQALIIWIDKLKQLHGETAKSDAMQRIISSR